MMRNTLLKYISVLVAAAVVLSGCGKEKKATEDRRGAMQDALVLQMRVPDSLNPLKADNQSVSDALSLCYEPLFAINSEMEPERVLARSIQISDDGKSAVISLKEGIVWHDGANFTTKDVIYTIERLKENSYLGYSDCVKHIEGVTPIDSHSLKITMTRPYGQIAYSLTFPIVAAHNDSIDEKIIGTGAYAMDKYTASTSLQLKGFDKWHGGDTVCDKAIISVVRDKETATSAFNTGIINVTTNESYDKENSVPVGSARSTLYPSLRYEFIVFNHKREIFSSQSVRAAVSSAIDRSVIAAESYGGSAQEANAPLHPQAKNIASTSIMQYNLAHAHEMLFFEGYTMDETSRLLKNESGEKISFTLLVNSDNQSRLKAAEAVRAQLYDAGIEVSVRELEFDEYAREISQGNFDAYLGGTKMGNLYDFEFLFANGGAMCNYGYESEYMNLALSALSCAASKDSLSDAAANFEEIFLREMPICGLVFCQDTLITGENVMGKLQPQPGYPYANIARWGVKK